MPRSLKVKEGRVTLIATEECLEIILDGVPVGRTFSPGSVADLTRALFKISEKFQDTELYSAKNKK